MNGKYMITAITIRGKSHEHLNIPNQDSYRYKIGKKFIYAAISDGMGSKKHSHTGSFNLVKTVIKEAEKFYMNKNKFELRILSKWKKKIKPYNTEECLSTLSFVIIKDQKIHIAKTGDGTIVVLGKNNFIIDDNKEFSNITTPFGKKKLTWHQFNEDNINVIFLATDGISDDIEDKIGFVKDFSNHFCVTSQNKEEIKEMIKNWPVKGSMDDKTLLCIKRIYE